MRQGSAWLGAAQRGWTAERGGRGSERLYFPRVAARTRPEAGKAAPLLERGAMARPDT